MPEGILGRKVGMTAVFMPDGRQVPVTVIETAGNKVLGKRTEPKNGYTAVMLGFGDKPAKRLNKPDLGLFEKGNLLEERDGKTFAKRFIREFRIPAEVLDGYNVGDVFAADRLFKAGDFVDIIGTSKGSGFTGVIQRHGFSGSKASHGVHEYFRHGGSIGANTYPAHVMKGKKMPGQSGNARVTIQNLKVIDVMAAEGLLLVKGGIPGPNGGMIHIQRAVKKRHG